MKIFILTMTMFFSFTGIAGNEGGGGGAVVCRDKEGNINSAELLDLFEAPLIHQIEIKKIDRPYLYQLGQMLNAFGKYEIIATNVVNEILKNTQFLPDGVILETPQDIGENIPRVMKKGCRLEGLGFYTDANKLLVVKDTFEHLSETDKAAFFLHEVIYYLYREYRGWERINETTVRKQMDSYVPRQAVARFTNYLLNYETKPSGFFEKNIFSNDDITNYFINLPDEEENSLTFHVTQSVAGPQNSSNTMTVQCMGYSKNVLYSKEIFVFDQGDHNFRWNMPPNSPRCKTLSITFKYGFLVNQLTLFHNEKWILRINENLDGHKHQGIRFNFGYEDTNH